MTTNQDIYAELEALLQPASLPGPWRHLPAPPDYRDGAPLHNLRTLASSLRRKYTDEELVSAGVLVRRPHLSLNPLLMIGNLLLLRRAPDEPPYEIVSVAGCISGSQPPVLAALDDAATRRRLEVYEGTMFATSKIEDAAVLQCLGYPAMPAAGLEKLGGSQLEEFCRVFDLRYLNWASSDEDEDEDKDGDDEDVGNPSDQASASQPPNVPRQSPTPTSAPTQPAAAAASPGQDPPAANQQRSPKPSSPRHQATLPTDLRLCFVAWHPAQVSLDIPERLASIETHLRELAGNLDLLMDQISVWRPAPGLEQKLSYALTHGTPKHVKRIIALSQDNSTYAMLLPDCAPTRQPATIREVLQGLGNDGGDRLDDRAAHLQDYRQLIDQQVTGPLLEQAEALTDPALKSCAVVKAHYLSQQLELLPQLGLGVKPKRQSGNGPLRPEEADCIKAAQKSLSDFLEFTDPAR